MPWLPGYPVLRNRTVSPLSTPLHHNSESSLDDTTTGAFLCGLANRITHPLMISLHMSCLVRDESHPRRHNGCPACKRTSPLKQIAPPHLSSLCQEKEWWRAGAVGTCLYARSTSLCTLHKSFPELPSVLHKFTTAALRSCCPSHRFHFEKPKRRPAGLGHNKAPLLSCRRPKRGERRPSPRVPAAEISVRCGQGWSSSLESPQFTAPQLESTCQSG